MRTKFSLGLGFTKDTKVTAISKDIPFVSTPNELHELVKTGKISGGLKSTEAVKEVAERKVAAKAKPAKRKAMTEVKSTKRKVAAKTKPAKREAMTEATPVKQKAAAKAKTAKQKEPQGIPNPVRGTLSAKPAKGFRKTVNRELGGSFHAPHEAVVGGTSAPVTRVSRPVVKEQSRFKRNAIFLLDSMSRTAGGKSSSDNAALNQARIDFYTSKEKIPCTDYVILFDREDAHSVEEQKEICRTCPLIDKCLKMALLGDEPFGVWGGMDPNERRVLKRRQMRIRRSNALGGINV